MSQRCKARNAASMPASSICWFGSGASPTSGHRARPEWSRRLRQLTGRCRCARPSSERYHAGGGSVTAYVPAETTRLARRRQSDCVLGEDLPRERRQSCKVSVVRMLGAANPLDQRCSLVLDRGLFHGRTVPIRTNSPVADQPVRIARFEGGIRAERKGAISPKIDAGRGALLRTLRSEINARTSENIGSHCQSHAIGGGVAGVR